MARSSKKTENDTEVAAREVEEEEVPEVTEANFCMRGGLADEHPAVWETTDKAAAPLRYCERHKPANHANLGLRKLS
jgi:hypothetical protein